MKLFMPIFMVFARFLFALLFQGLLALILFLRGDATQNRTPDFEKRTPDHQYPGHHKKTPKSNTQTKIWSFLGVGP
jgi:hypothetical protein